jgi:acyl-CoA thioesterase I
MQTCKSMCSRGAIMAAVSCALLLRPAEEARGAERTKSAQPGSPRPYLQVVLFGDSLSWSARAAYGQRYGDYLEAQLQRQAGADCVVDVAVCGDGGNTVGEGLQRLERDCLAYRPDIVVLSFGGNDSLRSTRTAFMRDYPALIETLKARTGARLIMESAVTRDYVWLDASNVTVRASIGELAGRYGVPYHDRCALFRQELARDPARSGALIRGDGVHLTIAGNRYYAGTLADLMAPLPSPPPSAAGEAEACLRRAESNAVFRSCCSALQGGLPLRQAPLERLPLQQCRSLARRAGTLAADADVVRRALVVERLAAGCLAAERVVHRFPDADPACARDSVAWAASLLETVKSEPLAETLLRRLSELDAETAQPPKAAR